MWRQHFIVSVGTDLDQLKKIACLKYYNYLDGYEWRQNYRIKLEEVKDDFNAIQKFAVEANEWMWDNRESIVFPTWKIIKLDIEQIKKHGIIPADQLKTL